MRTGKLYPNGFTCGTPPPPSKNDHLRALRKQTKGWTQSATRSNTNFLYSVVPQGLTGQGFAFTYTVKDLPATPADWHRSRRKLVERFRRMGMIRLHWLTEWQRRGVPHLHGIVFFDHELSIPEYISLTSHWLAAASDYQPAAISQHVKLIDNVEGWLKYLSKHGSRGAAHYQRSSPPPAWLTTGRMWGKLGQWETDVFSFAYASDSDFYRHRRILRSWRVADARRPVYDSMTGMTKVNGKRLKSARNCLKCHDRHLSNVRGMSEWSNEILTYQILTFLSENPQDPYISPPSKKRTRSEEGFDPLIPCTPA